MEFKQWRRENSGDMYSTNQLKIAAKGFKVENVNYRRFLLKHLSCLLNNGLEDLLPSFERMAFDENKSGLFNFVSENLEEWLSLDFELVNYLESYGAGLNTTQIRWLIDNRNDLHRLEDRELRETLQVLKNGSDSLIYFICSEPQKWIASSTVLKEMMISIDNEDKKNHKNWTINDRDEVVPFEDTQRDRGINWIIDNYNEVIRFQGNKVFFTTLAVRRESRKLLDFILENPDDWFGLTSEHMSFLMDIENYCNETVLDNLLNNIQCVKALNRGMLRMTYFSLIKGNQTFMDFFINENEIYSNLNLEQLECLENFMDCGNQSGIDWYLKNIGGGRSLNTQQVTCTNNAFEQKSQLLKTLIYTRSAHWFELTHEEMTDIVAKFNDYEFNNKQALIESSLFLNDKNIFSHFLNKGSAKQEVRKITSKLINHNRKSDFNPMLANFEKVVNLDNRNEQLILKLAVDQDGVVGIKILLDDPIILGKKSSIVGKIATRFLTKRNTLIDEKIFSKESITDLIIDFYENILPLTERCFKADLDANIIAENFDLLLSNDFDLSNPELINALKNLPAMNNTKRKNAVHDLIEKYSGGARLKEYILSPQTKKHTSIQSPYTAKESVFNNLALLTIISGFAEVPTFKQVNFENKDTGLSHRRLI